MFSLIATLGFMAFWWGVFYISFKMDRSRYRNCYLLFIAIMSIVPLLVNITSKFEKPIILIIFYAIFFGLLVLPYFLIHNGFVMIKKEGRQLPHMLSLALGIIILLGEFSLTANVIASILTYDYESSRRLVRSWYYILCMLFGISIVYASMSVLIFTIYIIMLQIIPWKKNFDFVIIHGSGLIDGDKVSKLLGDRIDKAIEVYKKNETRPKIIPSGGKGSDETISEAEAMKRYLVEKGIPETDIIIEDKSATTLENLINSKKIIDGYEGEKKVALVSSNYHVYRALRHCRKIGFKCSGIGAHTAFYYWPCALLREYIAVHVEKKHAIIFAIGWVLCMALTLMLLLM